MDANSLCEPRNFSRVLYILFVGWFGEVNLRKSVAVISITDLHVMVTWCISLTISLDYMPQIVQSPSCIRLIYKYYFVLMLQAVL